MTDHNKNKDIDKVSGVETTGHEWDGIKELNNPAPRWWLWVFYVTIIWSIGYWVVYPSWPTISGEGHRGGTVGVFETNQYKKLAESQKDIVALRAKYLQRFANASFEEISNDPELYEFALAGGQAAFKDNCATCHGTGGAGSKGYPNLNDDDWIWGGTYDDIHQTILYGIRNKNDDSRFSSMPAFGEMLSAKEQDEIASYVNKLSHSGTVSEEGYALFQENCASCHGEDARGGREFGAPNLADAIWLKSKNGSKHAILSQMRNPAHGSMPAWVDRLDEQTIRQLTIYVYSLGGGEKSSSESSVVDVEETMPQETTAPAVIEEATKEAAQVVETLEDAATKSVQE